MAVAARQQLPRLHITSDVHYLPAGVVGWHWLVDYLGHCDATLLCQLLFSLLAGIGVTEVRVEILVQDLCRLFVEVSSFPSEKSGNMSLVHVD